MSTTSATPPSTPREADDPVQSGLRPGAAVTAPRVFWPAAGIVLVVVGLALFLPERLGDTLSSLNGTVIGDLGWFYVLLVTSCIAFSLWVAFSPMGNVVLGKDDEEPEFGLKSWFAMLFAAGMGIGLVFWGVAEPLNHFASPPPGTRDGEAAAARAAMDTTFLHWGLHAWAIYVVVGLAIAYAVHRKGRPVSIRWALEPLFGDRVKGVLGDVIDVIAIVGTLFGVATSLGFGVSQVSAGMAYLGFVGEASTTLKVLLIVGISAIAIVSVVTGVDKGIKWLSNINMGMAALLLVIVAVVGPTVFILGDFVQQLGSYARNFFELSFRTMSFQGEDGSSWLSGWTTFYWGWWMSWAPFVGVFIARISRGRTVRQFVTGVLLVPTLVTFVWFSVMGGSAIYREMFGAGGLIGEDGAGLDRLRSLPAARWAARLGRAERPRDDPGRGLLRDQLGLGLLRGRHARQRWQPRAADLEPRLLGRARGSHRRGAAHRRCGQRCRRTRRPPDDGHLAGAPVQPGDDRDDGLHRQGAAPRELAQPAGRAAPPGGRGRRRGRPRQRELSRSDRRRPAHHQQALSRVTHS